jgi:hypothetical protein
LLEQIVGYFSLERPRFGSAGVIREIFLFTGVVAGVVGQSIIVALSTGNFPWINLIPGLIASIVIYPAIYYNAGLNKSNMSFVKWCVAFQNGYFWPSLLEQVSHGFQRSDMAAALIRVAGFFGFHG